jgi:phosphate transport system substrate-binding protein
MGRGYDAIGHPEVDMKRRFVASLAFALTLPVQASETIRIDGSSGVMPLAAAIAKAFRAADGRAAVELGQGLGTKQRLQALAEGKIDVALASHGIDVAEVSRQGMVVYEIARVPVVFGVNASVPVASLSEQQLCDIYAGRTSDWKPLGGPELPIAARTRPDSEVDAEVVRSAIKCLKDVDMARVKVMPRGGDMAKELAATPGSIGMTTTTVVEQSGGRIRALALAGVAPTAENVNRKAYGLVRQSFFIVKSPPAPAVARFLEFARGEAGARVIEANGALPVR